MDALDAAKTDGRKAVLLRVKSGDSGASRAADARVLNSAAAATRDADMKWTEGFMGSSPARA